MWRALNLFGLMLCASAVTFKQIPLFRKDYKFNNEAGGWIKFHNIPANWHEAELRCQLEGAVLASPLNEKMTTAMSKTMKTKANFIWTGIHATFSKGDYSSIEGVPLSKIPVDWDVNEPDNIDDNENCIALTSDGSIGDYNCSEQLSYTCYKKYDRNLKINECGTTDNEYKLERETGSCYKFHRDPRTWSRAFMTCSAEGGHLAVINSDKEAQVLSRIFSSVSTKTISIIKNQVLAFIGFHDWGEHGNWRTIHGQSLQEAGYSKWGKLYGEPNNVSDESTNNEGEFCGSIYPNGDLNDLWCDYVISFICEKPRFAVVNVNNDTDNSINVINKIDD